MVKANLKRKNKPGAGAPKKKEMELKGYAGLPKEDGRRVKDLAIERNVSQNAIIRQAVRWYLDALEMGKQIPAINQKMEEAEVLQEQSI